MIPNMPVDTHVAFAKEITRKHLSGGNPIQRASTQMESNRVWKNRLFDRLADIVEKLRHGTPAPAS